MIVIFGGLMFRSRDLRTVRFTTEQDPHGRNTSVFRVTVAVNVNATVVEHAYEEFTERVRANRLLDRFVEIMKDVSLNADDHKLIDMKVEEASSFQ